MTNKVFSIFSLAVFMFWLIDMNSISLKAEGAAASALNPENAGSPRQPTEEKMEIQETPLWMLEGGGINGAQWVTQVTSHPLAGQSLEISKDNFNDFVRLVANVKPGSEFYIRQVIPQGVMPSKQLQPKKSENDGYKLVSERQYAVRTVQCQVWTAQRDKVSGQVFFGLQQGLPQNELAQKMKTSGEASIKNVAFSCENPREAAELKFRMVNPSSSEGQEQYDVHIILQPTDGEGKPVQF